MAQELPFPEGYYVFDRANMKKLLDQFPGQVRDARKATDGIAIQKSQNIFYFGMGGSGIVGDLIKTYLYKKGIHIHVIKGYDPAEYVPPNSLLIFCSYSGNTEETLACYKMLTKNNQNILTLSSGGKLQELAKQNKNLHITIPRGYPPRNTIALQFFSLLHVFAKAGIIPPVDGEIDSFLHALDMKKINDIGADLSIKFKDLIPIVYGSHRYSSIVYRWRTQFNENAKVLAFSHEIPEMNHNELAGYTFVRGNFSVIILKFDDDHRRVQRRMDLMKTLIKKAGVDITELGFKGDLLTKMFSALLIGDYTSYYLALRYKIDPSPVKIIEKFKTDLGPFV